MPRQIAIQTRPPFAGFSIWLAMTVPSTLIVAHTVDAASAVDGVAVGIVLGRQALAALQAEVGRRRLGGVVPIVAGIVRGAVAVKTG